MMSGRSRVRWMQPGTINIVVDGNSIPAGGQDGAESVGSVTGYLHRNVSPFSEQSYTNCAIGGQNTNDMVDDHADVDAAFDPDKVNVLIVQEGTNQIAQTADTATQAVDKLFEFVAVCRAVHPWASVVVATTTPYFAGDMQTVEQNELFNQRLKGYDDELRSRWAEGADLFIDNRCPGSPYDQARYPNYLRATFFSSTVVDGVSNADSYVTEPEPDNAKVHWSAAGISLLAPIWSDALLRLPLRY